jgi:hypothetical protein
MISLLSVVYSSTAGPLPSSLISLLSFRFEDHEDVLSTGGGLYPIYPLYIKEMILVGLRYRLNGFNSKDGKCS